MDCRKLTRLPQIVLRRLFPYQGQALIVLGRWPPADPYRTDSRAAIRADNDIAAGYRRIVRAEIGTDDKPHAVVPFPYLV